MITDLGRRAFLSSLAAMSAAAAIRPRAARAQEAKRPKLRLAFKYNMIKINGSVEDKLNLAKKLGTSEEGAHMAMIGLTTFLTPGLFKIAWTPFALVELIKAYRKDGLKGATEAGKWYLKSSAAVITTKEGTTSAIKLISKAFKDS